jgi:hypothetical protein
MRAAYRRFGKHLTPDQAMAVYSEQYWTSLMSTIDKMTPEQLDQRFGKKTLDKINQMKLNLLKKKMDPSKQKGGDAPAKKKDHMTEREFEKHISQKLAGGL